MVSAKPSGAKTPRTVEIEIEDLIKSFGEHQVLRGIDLQVCRGDMVAILGGSGSGKTVLLNHILGQLTPDTGRIKVADYSRAETPLVDLATLDGQKLDDVHAHWGVVFQRNALFSGTVYSNIELWLREIKNLDDEDIRLIARDVLSAVSLPTDDVFMDTSVESLSGGMAKRVAIARALSMNPKVIFYDEPTTGLDPTSAAQVQDLIRETHVALGTDPPKRTTLIITHDKDLLRRLQPQVIMLHEGCVFFNGPFDDFESSPSDVIRPYFELMPVLQNRDRSSE